MKKILFLAGAMLCSIAAIRPASAQNVLNYNWGGMHVQPNQILSFQLRMDKAAVVSTLPVLFTLEDKQGNILYQKWTTVTNGQTVIWAAGWNIGAFGGGGAGQAAFDFYMDSPIEILLMASWKLVVPSIRIDVPGAAQPWVDLLTPTFEVVDSSPAYHVTSFANNPHLTVSPLRQ
jgi:hypothetical protein